MDRSVAGSGRNGRIRFDNDSIGTGSVDREVDEHEFILTIFTKAHLTRTMLLLCVFADRRAMGRPLWLDSRSVRLGERHCPGRMGGKQEKWM